MFGKKNDGIKVGKHKEKGIGACDGEGKQGSRQCRAEETVDCKCMSGGQVRSVTTAAGWATPVSMTN